MNAFTWNRSGIENRLCRNCLLRSLHLFEGMYTIDFFSLSLSLCIIVRWPPFEWCEFLIFLSLIAFFL